VILLALSSPVFPRLANVAVSSFAPKNELSETGVPFPLLLPSGGFAFGLAPDDGEDTGSTGVAIGVEKSEPGLKGVTGFDGIALGGGRNWEKRSGI